MDVSELTKTFWDLKEQHIIQDRLQASAGVILLSCWSSTCVYACGLCTRLQKHCHCPIRMLLLALRLDQAANRLCFVQTKLRSKLDAIFQRLPHQVCHNSSRFGDEMTAHDCSNLQQASDLAATCCQADLASAAQRQVANQFLTRAPAWSSL